MKIPAMQQTESINDVLCDVCGDSTRVEGKRPAAPPLLSLRG